MALRRYLKTTTQEQLHPESIAHSRGKLTEEVEQNKCLTDSSEVPNPSAQTAGDLIAELQQAGIRHTPENIIWITKLPNGKIVFLETGNTSAARQKYLSSSLNLFATLVFPLKGLGHSAVEVINEFQNALA